MTRVVSPHAVVYKVRARSELRGQCRHEMRTIDAICTRLKMFLLPDLHVIIYVKPPPPPKTTIDVLIILSSTNELFLLLTLPIHFSTEQRERHEN